MKKNILLFLLLYLTMTATAQLRIRASVTSVGVTGFCDLDGFGAGDSDPKWTIDMSDNRDYSESFDDEIGGNNGPSITNTGGWDNALTYDQTYSGICPPNYLIITWAAYENDALGSDARVDEVYSYPVPTVPGTYTLTRTKSISGACSGTTTWSVTMSIIVSGTLNYVCADAPCSAGTQIIQNPCAGALNFTRYDVSGSTSNFSAASTPCSYDNSNDIFFKFTAPASGEVTVEVSGWDDWSTFSQANLTGNLYEGACGTLGLSNTETLTNPSGGSSPGCIDFSSGVFNDINEGPFNFRNLTPSQDYWLRVSEEDNQSAYVDLAFVAGQQQDNCARAVPLSGTGCNYNAIGGDFPTPSNVSPAPPSTCGWSSMDNSVFYTFSVNAFTTQPIDLTVNSIVCNNVGGGDVQIGVWKKPATCPGNTTSYTALSNFHGCASGTGTVTVQTDGNLATAGRQNLPVGDYIVVVDGNAGAECTWAFTSSQVLPIRLTAFKGDMQKSENVLHWTTATESNTEYFLVQRSENGLDGFKEIGKLKAAGNSTKPVDYQLTDVMPLPKAYYRLLSHDFDGQEQLSQVITLDRTGNSFSFTNVYPIPTSGELTLTYNATTEELIYLNVFDMLGRNVMQRSLKPSIGFNTETLDLSGYNNANYVITISNGTHREVLKVVKSAN